MDDRFHLPGALRAIAGAAMYPALGYHLHRRGFRARDLDVDLAGKVCVVTGATSGLGAAIARALGALGARVVLVGRDRARGEAAARAAGDRAELELADLASVTAVHALAARIAARHDRVDVLVNNAGLSLWDFHAAPGGLERTFATNVLGGFVLTSLLLPQLLRAAPARIVHMTSAALYTTPLDTDALLSKDPRRYNGPLQYARTKRAQAELNVLWAERLAGTGVASSAVHPGLAATPGVAHSVPLYHRFTGPALRSPEQGADTAVWLAASPAAEGESGALWFDRAPRPLHAVPWTVSPRAEAERLRDACAALGGVPWG